MEELQFAEDPVQESSDCVLPSLEKNNVEVSLDIGIDAEGGGLVCKFNLFVMPGMPRSWSVVDTKRWRMLATCCGDLESCTTACYQSLVDFGRQRPFVYVTTNGEPPEVDSPPFTAMLCVGFVADCEPDILCELCKLPGVRALEIRKQRSPPMGYRVRIFHDGMTTLDPTVYIDPALLYDMAQVPPVNGRERAGSKAGKKKKSKKKLKPKDREILADTAANAAAKSEQYIMDSTLEVAEKLGEANIEVLERAVRFAGMGVIKQVMDSTMQLEETGGMMTADGTRRRKPGGVFLHMLPSHLSFDQHTLIFQRAPSPNLFAHKSYRSGDLVPDVMLAEAADTNGITVSSGSMLNMESDIQMGSSLGSSPPQNLLGMSIGSSSPPQNNNLGVSLGSSLGSTRSLSINAREFVPQGKSHDDDTEA